MSFRNFMNLVFVKYPEIFKIVVQATWYLAKGGSNPKKQKLAKFIIRRLVALKKASSFKEKIFLRPVEIK